MSGHLGRVGGRRVVAVLALGGGLLLGPVLPAQAGEDQAAGAAGTGPVPTALDAAQDLVSPVLTPGDERGRDAGRGTGLGKGQGKGHGGVHGKGKGRGQGRTEGA
ncbi:hypothetical protein ABZ920_01955 [Streptomyces sp. NPDC046831]|uniref:hypothetical protein n=1 Tax=Streptomyces sp. NPDC046831 TaxID=3154805 RepID=UPI0033F1AA96